ncbi:hypothetical protein [Rahnella laticis]|uniref:hypothetical protein n=1 Tax=Rahnella laticis TaxID=2787622 RepID=UPI0018A326D2|nr:hypothetical protein [Rahnella laticis]MBF7997194.1 hypothetical protein [Rahnella laticis]
MIELLQKNIVVGSVRYYNLQKKLMDAYPGKLILELPGAPVDLGIQDVEITTPYSMECPEGTK